MSRGAPIKMFNTEHPKGYALCIAPGGERIYRRAYAEQLGNFVMLSVRYNGAWYGVGSGDEYIRGSDGEIVFRIEDSRKLKR
jgi:hypothetical protein